MTRSCTGSECGDSAPRCPFWPLRPFAFAGEIPTSERRSGYDFMSRETRAMQDDDTANPGMSGCSRAPPSGAEDRRRGPRLRRVPRRCRTTMKGVAARHPSFDAARGRPVSLEQRINTCRVDRQQAPSLAYESRELLALTAYVARQSRGLPIDVAIDAHTQPFLDAGRATFHRRQGQLNLACAQCHDANWGRQLAATSSPRRIRPGTRSIGWSGRRSARSSGACATVSSASAPSRMTTARPRWSISSST